MPAPTSRKKAPLHMYSNPFAQTPSGTWQGQHMHMHSIRAQPGLEVVAQDHLVAEDMAQSSSSYSSGLGGLAEEDGIGRSKQRGLAKSCSMCCWHC